MFNKLLLGFCTVSLCLIGSVPGYEHVELLSNSGHVETLQVAGAGISQPTAASAVTDNVINVKSYGAKGDGKTEDTKAIYKAFKDAKTSGKTLYFPKGKYLIEWGQIYLELNEKGIKIQGDGKQESVIKLKETHNGGEFGNGIVLLSRSNPNIAPNVSISNIGITYDVYNSSLVFTRASTLLGLNGYFGKIYVDNCYFHIGGTSNNLPEDTCLFWHLGADLVSIKNCLIENFTHNEAGGDIWIMTDDNDGTKITNHKINKVIIQGNEIKSSNRDEAIGLYPSAKNTKPTDCFKSVLITENIIRHKKYNNNSKDCSPTDGLVTVFLPNDSVPPVNASIVISNNKIQSQMASQEVIRVVGFSGVDVANNKITVKGTTQKEILRTIYFGRDTKGVVENNTMDYSEITWCEVRVSLAGTAEAEWKNNDINTGGNFGISPTDGAKLVLKKNRITTLNDGIFVVRKNGDDARVFLYDNVVYGKTRLNYLYGTDFVIQGNKFNVNTNNTNKYIISNQSKTGSLDYQMNDGIIIEFYDKALTTKISSFTYRGKRSNLRFVVNDLEVPDSAETRAKFFISCDIQYTD